MFSVLLPGRTQRELLVITLTQDDVGHHHNSHVFLLSLVTDVLPLPKSQTLHLFYYGSRKNIINPITDIKTWDILILFSCFFYSLGLLVHLDMVPINKKLITMKWKTWKDHQCTKKKEIFINNQIDMKTCATVGQYKVKFDGNLSEWLLVYSWSSFSPSPSLINSQQCRCAFIRKVWLQAIIYDNGLR